MNVVMDFGSNLVWSTPIRITGVLNFTLKDSVITFNTGGYAITFLLANVPGIFSTFKIISTTFQGGEPLYWSNAIQIMNFGGELRSLVIRDSVFKNLSYAMVFWGGFGSSDIDDITIDNVVSDGSFYIYAGTSVGDSLINISITNIGLNLNHFSFTGINLVATGVGEITVSNVEVTRHSGGNGIIITVLNQPLDMDVYVSRVSVRFGPSYGFSGLYLYSWSVSTVGYVDWFVEDIVVSRAYRGIFLYNGLNIYANASIKDVSIDTHPIFGLGLTIYSFRPGGFNVRISDAVISTSSYGVFVNSYYERGVNISLSNVNITQYRTIGIFLVGYSSPPLFQGGYINIYGVNVYMDGGGLAGVSSWTFGNGLYNWVNGSFTHSIIWVIQLSGKTMLNFTESVVDEFSSSLSPPASSYFKWTLGVVVRSGLTGLPIAMHDVKYFLGPVLKAVKSTDFLGFAGETYEYWFNPGDPKMDDITVSVDGYLNSVSRNLFGDLGLTYTIPSWYMKIYLDVDLISLSAIGFSDGYGTSIMYISGFNGWILTYFSDLPYSDIPIKWVDSSGMLDGMWIYPIPSQYKISFRILGYVVSERFVTLTILVDYQGVDVRTYLYIDRVERVVWLPGPVKYIGYF